MLKNLLAMALLMFCACGPDLPEGQPTDDELSSETSIDDAQAQRARFDYEAFRRDLEDAARSAHSRHCVLALPNARFATDSQAEGVIRREVGTRYGANPNQISRSVIACGNNNPLTCAARFVNGVSAWDDSLAKAIKPSAATVDKEAARVRLIAWTVPDTGGSAAHTAFTLAGRRDRAILGLGFYADAKCRTSGQ